MSVFLVSYDLRKNKDYSSLWAEFERVKAHKVLDSVYLVSLSTTSVQTVIDWMKKYIDNDDLLERVVS